MLSSEKKVGVVCVTYRNPAKPSAVREFGLVALVEQMFSQKYGGNITLSVVDSSPSPHPYLKKVAEQYPDKLLYSHIPDRSLALEQDSVNSFIPTNDTLKNAIALCVSDLKDEGSFIPQEWNMLFQSDVFSDLDDSVYDVLIGRKPHSSFMTEEDITLLLSCVSIENLKNDKDTVFWAERIKETRDVAGFVPFEDDYPIQTNIFSQIFGSRPTIGMKKNYAIQALVDKGVAPEVIVFSDDDDHHSPEYVSKSVEALGSNDFTRMTRYLTHVFNADPSIAEHAWSTFDLRVNKDANGFWRLDPKQVNEVMYNLHPDGHVYDTAVGKKFSRLVTMAWPILSHEGALHTYSMDAWKRSVDAFGGCIPVSFCEDIIYYMRNKNTFGAAFNDVLTPIEDGQEHFIRIADGGNTSVIEWMEKRDNLPKWAGDAVKIVYDAIDSNKTLSEQLEIRSMPSLKMLS